MYVGIISLCSSNHVTMVQLDLNLTLVCTIGVRTGGDQGAHGPHRISKVHFGPPLCKIIDLYSNCTMITTYATIQLQLQFVSNS